MGNSELKSTKNGRFRNFLFGKKKKDTSEKRVCCNCNTSPQGTKNNKIVQTDSFSDDKNEEKMSILNVDNPKKIQQTGECQGKMFPLERRGCGFQLYFCIDRGVKPNLVRNNKIKTVKNYKNVSETESLTEMAKSHRSHSPFKNSRNINSRGREESPSETHSVVPEITVNRSRESEVGKHTNSSPRDQEETKTRRGNSILRTKPSQNTFQIRGEATTTSHSTLHSFPERHINHKETEVKNINDQKRDTDLTKHSSDPDEEAILKEYEALRKPKRSTLKSRRTFARNSLMSIRKKTQSFNDFLIPEIFSKLDHIEEQLVELERKLREKDGGKNTTNIVEKSNSNEKSIFPIDPQNRGDGSELNKNVSGNTNPSQPTSFKVQPVIIESYGEDVFVNAPESISVVKKVRSKQGSGHLVYYNTQELDAHNITSKSFSKTTEMNSQVPKAPLVMDSKSVTAAQKKDRSFMWRRICEELKC